MSRTLLTTLLLGISALHCTESDELKQLTKDHTTFAYSLYKTVNASSSSNLFFSPYSIATSLEMLFVGTRGETSDEIQTTLHLNANRTQIVPLSSRLRQALSERTPLIAANALWLGNAFFILSDYTHTIERSFGGTISRVNFSNPLEAIQSINGWVKEKTQGNITNLVQPGDLNADTRLVLTNAVYFKGSWQSPFDLTKTKEAPFYPTPEVSTPMMLMHQTAPFPFYENDLIQVVALPFANSPIAFVIVLPRSAENLSRVEEELDDNFHEWIDQLAQTHIDLKLPKFTLTERINLNETLQTLGMKLPFTTQANFSGIDGKLDLYLSTVLHQTFIALDEQGVTAAASTAAAIGVKSLPPSSPSTPFIADHPFLMFILNLDLKEVLFMGKFQEPPPREVHEL